MLYIKEFILNHISSLTFIILLSFVFYSILRKNKQSEYAKKLVQKSIQSGMNEPASLHPEIDPTKCAGCASCTKVCPEGDILKMIENKAVLVGPSKCVGHGECERACPVEAIKLVFGTKTRGMNIPRLNSNYETNVEGLYIAGELGGMGLIRNAIKQGTLAAKDALQKLPQVKTDVDILVVGAGPAGLAASLVAIAEKKSYLCIDQNSFGGTVYNFPRQKIVMSHPFTLPIVGLSKFNKNKVSKEELLEYWNEIKSKTGLKIQEKSKFEKLEKKENYFEVQVNEKIISAKKVILSMGVRGSPRKLGAPGELQSKVTYNLLEPDQYQNQHIVVVGGGNAGVEAAQMLCDIKLNNTVHLLVRSQSFDRCNEDNISRITALEKQGRVKILFKTEVVEILEKEIKIKTNDNITNLQNDFVFVFAGAEMPHQFLMSLGIQIDKKFAES